MTDLANVNVLMELGDAALAAAEKETNDGLRIDYIRLSMVLSRIEGKLSINRTQPPAKLPEGGICKNCGEGIETANIADKNTTVWVHSRTLVMHCEDLSGKAIGPFAEPIQEQIVS